MEIAVDVMGGDHGCGVIIGGARLALEVEERVRKLFLVGNGSEIEGVLAGMGWRDDRLEVVHASQFLTMEDKPVESLRRKRDSSVLRAVELVKDGRASAVISTGNTGGLVAAATVRLRPVEGVDRAAIATVIPSERSQFVLLDAGANSECRPYHLACFAVMGSVYSREILGVKSPRVGVLSNGKEAVKGNDLTREAYALCAQSGLNFVGYVEGHDLFRDEVDVVVTDGFVGNIVLKTCESMGKGVFRMLKSELTRSWTRRLGAWIARGAFYSIRNRMDADAYGGAPVLGLNGNVIKAHGSAREIAVKNAIRVAADSIEHGLSLRIQEEMKSLSASLTEGSAETRV